MDKKKLAVVHIVKKELNLSDKEYRDILEKCTGKRSSKDIDDSQFQKLMYYFVRTKHYQENINKITLKQKLYIDHLRKKLGWDEQHFINYLNKYYHQADLNKYTKEQASHLIVSLKKIAKYNP